MGSGSLPDCITGGEVMASWMAKMFNWEASRPKYRADDIVEHLHLREGDVVADIGSGGGFFSFAFSEKVGRSGTVYAVDTSKGNLAYIKAQAKRKGLQNVKTVLAEEEGLPLPEVGIDKVFLRNVFHHLKEPAAYFGAIRKSLRPNGKIVIIDHRETAGGGFVRSFKHYTREEDIVDALAQPGFELCERWDFLPSQSFLVFEASQGSQQNEVLRG